MRGICAATALATRTPFTRAPGNPILQAGVTWEASNTVQEPTVLYDGTTWKMWYTGGFSTPAMGYASCTGDPTVAANWTKYASNPVLGQGTVVAGWVSGNNVVKVGTTYYAYYYDANGGGNLKVSTSTDGITWGTPTTALAKGAASWVPGGWANSFVWNEGGTTWKMLVEGSTNAGGGPPWGISYATSTDGLSWTAQGTGLVSGLAVTGTQNSGGPYLANGGAKVNGRYQLWFHAGTGQVTDIYHAWSTDAQNWTITEPAIEIQHNALSYEVQQAADPSLVQQGNFVYLFYSGINNVNPAGYINAATWSGSLSSLCMWEQ